MAWRPFVVHSRSCGDALEQHSGNRLIGSVHPLNLLFLWIIIRIINKLKLFLITLACHLSGSQIVRSGGDTQWVLPVLYRVCIASGSSVAKDNNRICNLVRRSKRLPSERPANRSKLFKLSRFEILSPRKSPEIILLKLNTHTHTNQFILRAFNRTPLWEGAFFNSTTLKSDEWKSVANKEQCVPSTPSPIKVNRIRIRSHQKGTPPKIERLN